MTHEQAARAAQAAQALQSAQTRTEHAESRWAAIHALVAPLRVARQENHFAERIREAIDERK